MLDVLGRCALDIEAILRDMPALIQEENTNKDGRPFWKHVYSIFGNRQKDTEFKIVDAAYSRSFPKNSYFALNGDSCERFLVDFNSFISDISEYDMILKCYYNDDTISIVGPNLSERSVWVFPSKYVQLISYTDYNMLTGYERQLLLSGDNPKSAASAASAASAIISTSDLSRSDVISARDDAQHHIDKLNEDIQNVKESQIGDLKSLQQEIDKLTAELEAKKQSMLSDLDAKKREMEDQLEAMNLEIFKLDSEIYAIRCYTGEVLELTKLRSGKPASEDTPLVFLQKMRYLDEELGKIASIYNVDYDDKTKFESLLKYRDDVMESFTPSTRSLVLVRVSRSNKGFNLVEGRNVLDWYEKYHGKKVAIILRDGENLYIAWTDDDRIFFSDDAFLKAGQHEVTEEDRSFFTQRQYESDRDYKKRIKTRQMTEAESTLGRYFIFSLLQGIVDRGVIKFPEHVQIMNSRYVVFSYADGWLTSNEYGSFADMIDRCNASIKLGDQVLTIQRLRAEQPSSSYGYWSRQWSNDRGRGEKNRTHDVTASDNTIYPINFIEHYAKYTYMIVEGQNKREGDRTWTDEEYKSALNKQGAYSFNGRNYSWYYDKIIKIDGSDHYEYFISLEKTENWETKKSARANFQIYTDEFINLTFMNSVWLQYVLTNHKTDGIRIGGEYVDFAHVIPYIKTALRYVKEREEIVAEYIKNINPAVLEDIKWPVKLSEWMLKNDIHNFSEFRAKQFVKSL